MVEGNGLENRSTFTGTAGSNPAPSSKRNRFNSVLFYYIAQDGLWLVLALIILTKFCIAVKVVP